MTRYRVLPYKSGSKSAKAIATGLGGKLLKLQNSKFVAKFHDVIINWGNSWFDDFDDSEDDGDATILNYPSKLNEVTNKLHFFNALSFIEAQHLIPRYWVNKGDIPDDAYPIVCRTILNGHSGAGISIANKPDDLVDAPLYVQYIKKSDEYRIHVGRKRNGEDRIIAIQRKARRLGFDNPNWQVRNHANGFVFVRNNVDPPVAVVDAAKRALEATSLDFGAVDVIWNNQQQRPYVLEINTAPGLEGQTITDYVNYFKEIGQHG